VIATRSVYRKLDLSSVQLAIQPLALYQLPVIAYLDDPSVLQRDDLGRIADRA
jgi:hypothetical protein